jgi:hypothetical protein
LLSPLAANALHHTLSECVASVNDGNPAQDLDGRTIRVDRVVPASERPPREERPARANNSKAFVDSPYRLYVGNLPWRFDDYDLEDAFGEFGEVQDAKVMFDRETGRCVCASLPPSRVCMMHSRERVLRPSHTRELYALDVRQ